MPQSSRMRLARARRSLDVAREICPHWDYEDDGAGHPCCDAVQLATSEFRRAGHVYLAEVE
jgi:hypothetical protein